VKLVALGLGDQHAAGIRAEVERGIEIGRIGTVHSAGLRSAGGGELGVIGVTGRG
jgi:hypothetical protein